MPYSSFDLPLATKPVRYSTSLKSLPPLLKRIILLIYLWLIHSIKYTFLPCT